MALNYFHKLLHTLKVKVSAYTETCYRLGTPQSYIYDNTIYVIMQAQALISFMQNQKDPYYSKKDTLRWREASFQIIQVYMRKVLRPTYSFETHPMNGTNQLNGTSIAIIHKYYANVKLKLQQLKLQQSRLYRGEI